MCIDYVESLAVYSVYQRNKRILTFDFFLTLSLMIALILALNENT